MLHPMLREIVERVERVVAVEVRPCGKASPQTAMDVDPVGDSWQRMDGAVRGVAGAFGTPIQHGTSERRLAGDEPCTHPGHYELE